MKLIFLVPFSILSLAGVGATGPGGKMLYSGDLPLGDIRALLNSEFMSPNNEDNTVNQFSHCSSSATPGATSSTTTGEDDSELVKDEANVEETIASKYKIAHCGQYGDAYCAANTVTCDSSGRVVKKSGCERYRYCDECYQTCVCVKA